MNNQLTKLKDGKIIKKSGVTEQQLIDRLYKYERFGTVGKIRDMIQQSKISDDIWRRQLNMALSDAFYLKHERDSYKSSYMTLKSEFDASVKFREINKGLREQCKKYKQQLAERNLQIEKLKGAKK